MRDMFLLTTGFIKHLLRGAFISIGVDTGGRIWDWLDGVCFGRRWGRIRTVEDVGDVFFGSAGGGFRVVGHLRGVIISGLAWTGLGVDLLTMPCLMLEEKSLRPKSDMFVVFCKSVFYNYVRDSDAVF